MPAKRPIQVRNAKKLARANAAFELVGVGDDLVVGVSEAVLDVKIPVVDVLLADRIYGGFVHAVVVKVGEPT